MDWVTTLSAGLGQIVFFLNYVADSVGRLSQGKFLEQLQAALAYDDAYAAFVASQNLALNPIASAPLNPIQADRAAGVVINVNNGNITAQEIANKVNKANRATGTNLIRAQ